MSRGWDRAFWIALTIIWINVLAIAALTLRIALR